MYLCCLNQWLDCHCSRQFSANHWSHTDFYDDFVTDLLLLLCLLFSMFSFFFVCLFFVLITLINIICCCWCYNLTILMQPRGFEYFLVYFLRLNVWLCIVMRLKVVRLWRLVELVEVEHSLWHQYESCVRMRPPDAHDHIELQDQPSHVAPANGFLHVRFVTVICCKEETKKKFNFEWKKFNFEWKKLRIKLIYLKNEGEI